jgi:hypothetical protein
MIPDVVSHPFGERHVKRNQTDWVAAHFKPLNLRIRRNVERAHLNAIKLRCAWTGIEFTGRNRLTAKEEMLSTFLLFKCALHGLLHRRVPPSKGSLRR